MENLRYDAAFAWTKEEVAVLADYGFETKSVVGGKYAKVLYKGNYEKAEEGWYGLYAWIEKNGYEFRDEPAFEKYLNFPEEVEEFEKYLNLPEEVIEEDLLVEIYVPLVQIGLNPYL